MTAWRRWHRLDGWGGHFWRTYRVRVAAVTTLSAHGGGIFRVDLAELDRLAGANRLQPAYFAAWGDWQVGRLTDVEPER